MTVCRIMAYEPQTFGFETTNSVAYQDFKFAPERVSKMAPVVHPVQTKAPAAHFTSTNKRELKRHQYRAPAIDSIPYP